MLASSREAVFAASLSQPPNWLVCPQTSPCEFPFLCHNVLFLSLSWHMQTLQCCDLGETMRLPIRMYQPHDFASCHSSNVGVCWAGLASLIIWKGTVSRMTLRSHDTTLLALCLFQYRCNLRFMQLKGYLTSREGNRRLPCCHHTERTNETEALRRHSLSAHSSH